LDIRIKRTQNLHDETIEATRDEKEILTDSDISEIDCRVMNAFLDGLPYEIQQIIKNKNNQTLSEVYRTAEKKIRY